MRACFSGPAGSFLPRKTEMNQDGSVESLKVVEVLGKDGFENVYIQRLVLVNRDVPEADHGLHFLG